LAVIEGAYMMAFNLTRSKSSTLKMPDLKDYLTTEEAAKALGFHVEHIRRMRRDGDLEGLRVGQMWFISKKSVTDYKKQTEGFSKFDPRRGNK